MTRRRTVRSTRGPGRAGHSLWRRPRRLLLSIGELRRSKVASWIAAGSLVSLSAIDISWARAGALFPLTLLLVLGAAGMSVTLLMGDDLGLQLGLVALVLGTALADLPLDRAGAALEAATVGGLLVVLTQAVSWVASTRAGTSSRGHPGAPRAIWVAGVAVVGAGLGVGADALRSDFSDLGVAAVALGAVGAVACVALVAALARSQVRP